MTDESRMEPPDPFLTEHLAADRDVPAFDPTKALRLEARLLASIDAGVPPLDEGVPDAPTASPAPSPTATGTSALGAKLALLTGVVGFSLGAAVGWVGHARLGSNATPPRAPDVQAAHPAVDAGMPTAELAAIPAPAVPREPTESPSTTNESATATTVATRRDAGRASVVAARDAGAGRDDELADENALITRAQSALARGRASEAMEAVREHQRRFPGGRFGEEREALAVQALARMGQHDAASERAERFFARYPRSLLTRAVRAAVAP